MKKITISLLITSLLLVSLVIANNPTIQERYRTLTHLIWNENVKISGEGMTPYLLLNSDELLDSTPAYIWSADAIGLSIGHIYNTPQLTLHQTTGELQVQNLVGQNTAYACIDENGIIFRSNTPCTQLNNNLIRGQTK